MSALARLAAVALAIVSAQALAGAESGFHDESGEQEGVVFFGFVKDARGAPIGDAKVSATLKGAHTFVVRSAATGAYRLPTFNSQINPVDVTIACEKQGFKQTRVIRRPAAKTKPPKVETECRMERG